MTEPSSTASLADVPSLALAGTVTGGGGGALVEALDGPGALARWLAVHHEVVGEAGPDAPLRVIEFRTLRDAVRALLAASVEGCPLPPGAVALVNGLSSSAPVRVQLDVTDPGRPIARTSASPGNPTVAILAGIARSAIELVGGPDRDRLRRCEAPRCGRFFLQERGGQRWCGPACGNRARVARYHERRRSGT
jgi:predicted RNA-binding Zn ribbon-like protein